MTASVPDEQCAPVIEGLIAALCEKPQVVQLTADALPGKIRWSFLTDDYDIKKVMGRFGRHMRAYQLIVECMAPTGDTWLLTTLNDPTRRPGGNKERERPAHHDPAKDTKLLNETLACLRVAAYVEVKGDVAQGFRFTVAPFAQQDHQTLVQPHRAVYTKTHPDERDPINLRWALDNIFDAIGSRQGVKYAVEVA